MPTVIPYVCNNRGCSNFRSRTPLLGNSTISPTFKMYCNVCSSSRIQGSQEVESSSDSDSSPRAQRRKKEESLDRFCRRWKVSKFWVALFCLFHIVPPKYTSESAFVRQSRLESIVFFNFPQSLFRGPYRRMVWQVRSSGGRWWHQIQERLPLRHTYSN